MAEHDTTRAQKAKARLAALVEPATTAVVTMELQQGIVGPAALLPALADEVAAAGTLDATVRVCDSARGAGIRVVHNLAVTRPDGAGGAVNCGIFAIADKMRREQGVSPTEIGTDGAALMPELGEDPRDIVVSRLHGMTPFLGTSLDQVLRNIGVTTIVVCGVSVNLGVFGMCMGGLDLGYQVVLVADAVAGVPREYAESVIENSLSLITTVTTSADVTAIWDR